jgi:enoyl-CoA hydratase/carnithine racemase
MDGIVMGGGMGISQGASLRIVTERTRMAMPETAIGLFPDVGGGYFLSRCPGRVGEWLALTGETIGADDAIAYGLADRKCAAAELSGLWQGLGQASFADRMAVEAWLAERLGANHAIPLQLCAELDDCFALSNATGIVHALEGRTASPVAQATARLLRKRSPLMLHVVLEQVRRARAMSLADDLRMERDLVHHCFHGRPAGSETVEGIRALAVDKDHAPRWNPARLEDVAPEMVAAFFRSPWAAEAHPLKDLQ